MLIGYSSSQLSKFLHVFTLSLIIFMYSPFMSLSNNFYKFTLISFLAWGVLTFTHISFAQEAMNTTNTTSFTDSAGATTDNGFNALWLLSLIALPILLYMVWPRKQSSSMDLSTGYAGVKGGRAEKTSETKIEAEEDL